MPTAFAMNSGYYAGEAAAREAMSSAMPDVRAELLQRLADQAMSALERAPSDAPSPDGLHDQLSMLAGPIIDSMRLDGSIIESMIARSSDLYAAASATRADNLHGLIKVHEARNVAENARLIYASALDRTESREQFYRSDFPETDDDEWFCLHGVTRTDDGIRFDRIPFEVDRFPLQRSKRIKGKPSPIAAIFAGTYEASAYE